MDTLITANLLMETPSARRDDAWAEDNYCRTHAPRRPRTLAGFASLAVVLVSLVAAAFDRLAG